MEDLVLSAIVRANKLGAQGLRVVTYIVPQAASEDPDYKLVVEYPKITSASECPWWDK